MQDLVDSATLCVGGGRGGGGSEGARAGGGIEDPLPVGTAGAEGKGG